MNEKVIHAWQRPGGGYSEGNIYTRTDFLGNPQIDDVDIRLGTPIS